MSGTARILELRSSPHLSSGASVDAIMWNVVLALLPTAFFAVWSFGLAAALTLIAAVSACVVSEALLTRWSGRAGTLRDGSVWITGLLYGLTLPPALPLWMTFCGGFVAVAMGKFLFGGLGQNAFNPALVGRAFLQAAFPVAMTRWSAPLADDRFSAVSMAQLAPPLGSPEYDGMSAATPLAMMKFEGIPTDAGSLLFGATAGSTGETCALLIALGGAYLAARRMLNWRIPVAVLATVAGLCALLRLWLPTSVPSPLFMIGSGGLMLGAVFMATDMVASPITALGAVMYGILIGVLVVVIRVWGGMPEGVMYAILLANAVSPHIDRFAQPRAYGTGRPPP